MGRFPISCFLFLSFFLYVRAEINSSIKQPLATSLSPNTSSQLFPNASSTSIPKFPYIVPFGQTQACNIYGPLCQTGSITVGLNLTTATTTTILPCSSYLSAQAAHLEYENDPGAPPTLMDEQFWSDDIDDNLDLGDWIVGFGQSPECRSYAEAMNKGQYTFSNCGSSNTVIQTVGGLDLNFSYPSQIPPALVRYESPDEYATCCGNCSLDIPRVRLYYFPDKSTDCYQNQTSNITSTLSVQNLEKRIRSLVANGSIAVVSGHTFTSPSLYLQLIGTATVTDQCTTVGPMLTNPIITLAPGELSTWKPDPNQGYDENDNFTVGEIWQDPSGILGEDIAAGIAPLEIRDLACPTWGLGESTSANGIVVTTIGPPWLPLIVPPMNIFSLDPIWAAICTGIFSNSPGLTTFFLYDPPIALTSAPAPLLLPTPPARPTPAPAPADPTLVSQQARPSTEAARPASLPNDPAAPAKTGDSGKNTPTQSPDIASADPAGSADLPEHSAASSKNEGDLPSDPPSDPKVPAVPLPQSAEDPQPQAQGLGAIIYNAFGKGGSQPDGLSTTSLPPPSVFAVGAQTFTANPTGFGVPGGTAQTVDGTTISFDKSGVLAIGTSTVSLTNPSSTPVLAVAGQTFTPNPSAFSVAGTIVSAGGPAVTVDGAVISLGQSGALAIGSTTISLVTPSTKAFTVAGQTFTPNPSAFSIAGTTISADGPAGTISGTIISLGQHGALKIGSSIINLPTPSHSIPSKVYAVAGQVFTPNPSAFLVAGTTISAGGPAATVGGTIISLGSSGTLVVGSTTTPLLPLKAFASDVDIDGFDVIAHSSFVVVDGATVDAAAAGVTVSGKVVSLEAGGATLAIGTGRFALPTPPAATNGSVNVQAFVGGQKKGLEVSLSLIWCICGTLMLSMRH